MMAEGKWRKELTELSVKKEILELESKVLDEFADREDNDLEACQLLDLKKKLSEIEEEIFKAKLYIVSRSTGLLQRQMENTINEEIQNLEEKIKQGSDQAMEMQYEMQQKKEQLELM